MNPSTRTIQNESLEPNQPLVAESRPHSSAAIRQKAWKCCESPGWDRPLTVLLCSVEPPSYSARGDGDPGIYEWKEAGELRELQGSQVLQVRICNGWLFLCLLFLCLPCCALVFVELSRADHEPMTGYCSGRHSVCCCPMVEQRRASSIPSQIGALLVLRVAQRFSELSRNKCRKCRSHSRRRSHRKNTCAMRRVVKEEYMGIHCFVLYRGRAGVHSSSSHSLHPALPRHFPD